MDDRELRMICLEKAIYGRDALEDAEATLDRARKFFEFVTQKEPENGTHPQD